MALTRYGDLQFRYNTQETVELKEVPIIGNEIPNVNHKNFDESTTIVCAGGTGVTSELDKRRAYRSTACHKVSMGAGATSTTVTWTPAAAVNFRQHRAAEVNKFASVSKTGKYLSGGTSFKDSFVFVLNLAYHQATADASGSFEVEVYSGAKKAASATQYLASHGVYYRDTYQFRMTADDWTYSVGFTDADWDAVTSVVVIFTKSDYDTYFYIHNIASALPKYSADITDAYYPEVTEANSIFISQLFGLDVNAGTRSAPVKTIEKALSLIDAAAADFVNAIIMDSETYKPISLTYTYAGIKQTLDRNTNILADYLETPQISAEPGLTSEIRVGARDNYRSRWYTGGLATTYFVAKTGNDGTGTAGDITKPYLTIQAALTAASNGGCVEIIDSGTYDEVVTADIAVTIQAAPGCKPVMKKTGGNTVLDMNSQNVLVYGITFQGNSAASAQIIKTGTTANGQMIFDCSFTGIGTGSGTATAIYYGATSGGALTIENCLFINNGENFIAIEEVSGTSGTIIIKNCYAYMGATTANSFVKAGKATASALSTVISSCDFAGSITACLSYVYNISDAAAAAGITYAFLFFSRVQPRILTNATNSILIQARIYNNYFHDNRCHEKYIDCKGTSSYARGIFIDDNVFYRIYATTSSVNYRVVDVGTYSSAAQVSIKRNIFKDCLLVICVFTTTEYIYPYGCIFYNCGVGVGIGGTMTSHMITGCYFLHCDTAIYTYDSGGQVAVYQSFYYDSIMISVGGSAINLATSVLNADPNFYDSEALDFSFGKDSLAETITETYTFYMSPFIYPAGAFELTNKFIDFVGSYGKCISTAAATIKMQYCDIRGFLSGLLSEAGITSAENCLFENNGWGMRLSHATPNTVATCQYNIFNNNRTGIMLRSAAVINHCTVVNGAYGIVGLFGGFYAIEDYISDYLSITNTIVFDNAVYDYHYNLPTDYCIIGTRYYDMLETSHVDYKNTVGAHDVTDNPVLTSDYFPALKIMGYKYDSPAYMSASDGVSNIGARYVNRIYAALSYDSYTLAANPQTYEYRMTPVNLESSVDMDGNYDAEVDADMVQISLNWGTAGRDSKILAVQKVAMQYIYQTYWIVGISTDDGVTWTYYKVHKETNPQTKQIGFYYKELPWGEWTMDFNQLPSDFDVTDYAVNTMEA